MEDNVEQGPVEPKDLDGHHVRTMTEHRYPVHLRPLFFAGHSEISAKRIVSFEGQFTDVSNHFDASGPTREPYRTAEVFRGYKEGVPLDMRDLEYGGLNRAHQLTQDKSGRSSPPCALIGQGCQVKTQPTSLAYAIEGAHTYMCATCKKNWRDFKRQSEETLDWLSLFEGFYKRLEACEHNEFHLPRNDEVRECCGGEEVRNRVILNLISHSVCMRCNANAGPST